ncbi:hypothetical protein HanRHA438_Chr03g0142041 [Helianthus annuus]|nr:hypothetical protein HanOQP8_Chr03g0121151 [Helianthus annuus]KAJ0937426.1 hypothetical protein HanRHA438_Chr03g0142041 [Helianthus annuus]
MTTPALPDSKLPRSKILNDLRACNTCIRQSWRVHSFRKRLLPVVYKTVQYPMQVILLISHFQTRTAPEIHDCPSHVLLSSTGPDWVISSPPSSTGTG